MEFDWSALGQVAAVSLGVTVAVVVVFALGVLGLSREEDARQGAAARPPSDGPRRPCASSRAARWWRTAST